MMKVASSDFQEIVEHILAKGASVRFAVQGGSMAPAIRHGEIVMVSPVGDVPLRAGEIVLLASKVEGLMLHRIVEISEDGRGARMLTKGDASRVADKPVGCNEILGRVTRIEGTERS